MNSSGDLTRASGEGDAWASRLAPRLRVIQASFSDREPSERKALLLEEIKRELRRLPETSRARSLEALAEYFPLFSAPVDPPAQVPPPPELSGSELADRLIAMAVTMSTEERVALSVRLRAAGLMVLVATGPDLPPELRGRLGVPPEKPIDPERFAKLFAIFAETALTLDQVIWPLWRRFAPQSAIKRESSEVVRAFLGRYLQGDREVATFQIKQLFDRTRQLTVSILSAFGSAGEGFARWYLAKFAPEKIRAAVDAAGANFLSSPDQRCWRRYVELAEGMNGPTVEAQITQGVVGYVETINAKADTPARTS
ncbi:MAG TPA: hypothetical protein VGD78_10710 [Chthoniobacterales bacterium]